MLHPAVFWIPLVLPGPPAPQDADAASNASPQAAADEGILPVPDYSGDWAERIKLTGDWGGTRQDWAARGVQLEFDWYHSYQSIVDGGRDEDSAYSTNLDYRLTLDLMRMGVVPGALVNVRAQSRFGDTVNGDSGLLLPVDTYSTFPLGTDGDNDVDITLTELNWVQFVSEEAGVLAGKVTTLKTTNEFMGGEGRTRFMNFQFIFPSTLAQLAPYSTLAVGGLWMPESAWSFSTLLMNTTDASTSSGFDDIGDGATWATYASYRYDMDDKPGGGTFGLFYAFDGEFAELGGLNIDPGTGVSVDSESEAWALSWSGWQYLTTEDDDTSTLDPENGRQDLQGLGVFTQLGLADDNTNPTSWTVAAGLSGRGSFEGRDDDTWGLGAFYNDLQNLGLGPLEFADSTSGVEAFYDFALTPSIFLTLDVQYVESAFPRVDDATVLGARFRVSF